MELILTTAVSSAFAYKDTINERIFKKNVAPKYVGIEPIALIDKRCWLFKDDQQGLLVVAFRGSDSPSDLVQSLKFYPVPFGSYNGSVMKVHAGFLEYYNVVRDDVLCAVKEHACSQSVIAFTGHSLGGCAAIMAAVEIAIDSKTKKSENWHQHHLHCITYGAPAVGNKSFCNAYNELIPNSQRYVCGADATPRVPIPGLRHVKGGIYLPADNWRGVTDTIAHHTMTTYIKPLRARARALSIKPHAMDRLSIRSLL
jgi:hypothetical protein